MFVNKQCFWVFFLLFAMLPACKYSGSKKELKRTFQVHERLIAANFTFISEDSEEMDPFYDDKEAFLQNYRTVSQLGDTLKVTTLHQVNACGKPIGNISFSRDTLYLSTIETAEELCTSVDYVLFEYKILNPNKYDYVIKNK